MTLNTDHLRRAYDALLDAAAQVDQPNGGALTPPNGGWDADQVLAHVALVDAATIATAATVASGAAATYDNRLSLEAWTIGRARARAGGRAGLHDRIRRQGEALCALSDADLDTAIPTLLLSNDEVLVDQPVALRAILTGLVEDHLPRHAAQLLALVPTGPKSAVTA